MKKIIYFYIIYSFFALLVNMVHPVTPLFFNTLQFGSFVYGLSFALMAFFSFLSSIVFADLTKRYGSSKVMALSFVGYGIAQIVFLWTKQILTLIIARSLAGIFMSGLMVSSLSYILSISHNVTYLSIYAMIQTVGSAVGYFMGGFIGQWGYQITFYVQIIGCFMASLLAFWLLEKQPIQTSDIQYRNPFALFYRQLKNTDTTLLWFIGSVLFTSLAYFMQDNWLNYYFNHHYQFTSLQIGYFKLAVAMISFCANLLLIFFLNRYSTLLIYILLGCGLSLGVTYFFEDLRLFLSGMLIYSFFSVLFLPLQQNHLKQIPSNDSRQSGLFNSIRSLGMMLGPVLSGGLYLIHDKLTLVVSVISFLVATYMMFIYFKHKYH